MGAGLVWLREQRCMAVETATSIYVKLASIKGCRSKRRRRSK
jgi:hypothetical protein